MQLRPPSRKHRTCPRRAPEAGANAAASDLESTAGGEHGKGKTGRVARIRRQVARPLRVFDNTAAGPTRGARPKSSKSPGFLSETCPPGHSRDPVFASTPLQPTPYGDQRDRHKVRVPGGGHLAKRCGTRVCAKARADGMRRPGQNGHAAREAIRLRQFPPRPGPSALGHSILPLVAIGTTTTRRTAAASSGVTGASILHVEQHFCARGAQGKQYAPRQHA